MTNTAADLLAHYTAGADEDGRLHRSAHGRLELLRTQELLRRHLPPPPARILDVGGGTGVHANWLVADGYEVVLFDLVPVHVKRARRTVGVAAALADARALPVPDSSVTAALLLGPLYHLSDPAGRARALAEARRVVRPGGIVAAAGISRYLGLLEAGSQGRLDDRVEASVQRTLHDGHYDGTLGFVPAHFHTAAELEDELRAAGLGDVTVYGIEGPTWHALDAVPLDHTGTLLRDAVRCARLVETDRAIIAASAHLLAVAPIPDDAPPAGAGSARFPQPAW